MKSGYFNKKSCEKYNIKLNTNYVRITDNKRQLWKVTNVTKFYIHLHTSGYTAICITKEFNNKYKELEE
jgi:hypothetical protein